MEKIKENRLGAILMALVLILTSLVPALAATPPATTDLVVNKLQYNENTTPPEIQNTGSEMELPTGVTRYSKADYGDVEFTVYALDTKAVKDALATGDKTAQDLADEFAANTSLYGGSVVKAATVVDENGQVTFEDLPSNANQIYVIVETKHPATVVTPAKPMLVQLPITN